MHTTFQPVRLKGLDTLRAFAITLVLMSHYNGFVAQDSTFGFIGEVGWAGVDLFFVLSGYLIGNQLLAPASHGEPLSLKSFFARRLLRTLPNYYVVLAVYLLLPHSVIWGKTMAPAWRYLSFTQNFGQRYGETFTHSWSLCIEEQFYLVLPLAVLALGGAKRSPRWLWSVLAAAIGAGIAMRATNFMNGQEAFSAPAYYSTWCRFDEFLPGVAIAMLKNFHPTLFDRILKHGNILLAAGLAMAAAVLYAVRYDAPNLFLTSTFGFSMVAISFALLTCAALSSNSLLNRVRVPGATSLAIWSYAIYLAHKPIFMALRPELKQYGIDSGAPLTIAGVMAAGVFGGWLLYFFVETPFMRLRARWFPTVEKPVVRAVRVRPVASA